MITTREIYIKPNMFNAFKPLYIRLIMSDIVKLYIRQDDIVNNKYIISLCGRIKSFGDSFITLYCLSTEAVINIKYDDILYCDIDVYGYKEFYSYPIYEFPVSRCYAKVVRTADDPLKVFNTDYTQIKDNMIYFPVYYNDEMISYLIGMTVDTSYLAYTESLINLYKTNPELVLDYVGDKFILIPKNTNI